MQIDPIDELIHRAHNASTGAPPEFMGRLRARMLAEQVDRRRARRAYIQAAVSVAAVVVLALAIGLNWQWIGSPSRVANEPAAAEAPTANTPVADPPAANQPAPEPQPEPVPGTEPKPEIKPDPVKPEPRPDETVEKPAPEPQPEPTPEPDKPEGTVEKPEPAQPDPPKGTEARPAPDARWSRVSVAGSPKLKFRYEGGEWREYDGSILMDGAFLKAGSAPVDMTLSGGGIARFNGELRLTLDEGDVGFELLDDSLYVDNLETGQPVVVRNRGHVVAMEGVGMVAASRAALEAVCLFGAVSLNEATVPQGFSVRATKDGLGAAKEFKGDSFLKDLPPRTLLREDFEKAPEGGMYNEGERIRDGVVVMDRAPRYIAFRYNPTLKVLPGMVVRIRLRTTAVTRLELELFALYTITPLERNEEVMFKTKWQPEKNDEWVTVEFRVQQIPNNKDATEFPQPGDLLRNFKLHYEGKKLEIDWVEFVRVQD